MSTPHPGLSHSPSALAGMKTPQGPMGAGICGLTDPCPQALHVARSAPMLPLVVRGDPLLTHQQDPKLPMPNG